MKTSLCAKQNLLFLCESFLNLGVKFITRSTWKISNYSILLFICFKVKIAQSIKNSEWKDKYKKITDKVVCKKRKGEEPHLREMSIQPPRDEEEKKSRRFSRKSPRQKRELPRAPPAKHRAGNNRSRDSHARERKRQSKARGEGG